MQVAAMKPTTHTPPDPHRRPGEQRQQLGKRGAFLLGLKVQRLRDLCTKYQHVAPHMHDGHAARLEHAVTRALELMDAEDKVLSKWDRARGISRRDVVDSADLKSIEDGGNG
jgi:hypothetical protein